MAENKPEKPKQPESKKGRSKKLAYAAYRTQDRRLKNKVRKMARHLRNFPNDNRAAAELRIANGGRVPTNALDATHKGRKVIKRASEKPLNWPAWA